jgi:sulfate transport system ATP-binding protein
MDEETPAIHDAATGDFVYVRPHLLEIQRQPNGGSNFRAVIKHINSAGPLVKIEALSEWGAPVQVEMSQEKFQELQLAREETVFIVPRELKIFHQKAI